MHGYVYSALNRLEKAWGAAGTEAEYIYNGLGQRTGRKTEEKQEDYVLDLTRAYHNLLEVEKGKGSQQFYWDFGAAAMEEKGRAPRYYLADELGSPLRVLYGNGNGEVYGYDEFGGELYEAPDPEKEAEARYSRQGEGQPFGYTGYRYDVVSGTYFAQAREYQAVFGRFTAEDVVRGNGLIPKTLNRYGYCWNDPMVLVDLDGKMPTIIYLDMDATHAIVESAKNVSENIVDTISNVVDSATEKVIEMKDKWVKSNPDNVVAKVLNGDIGLQFSDTERELMKKNPMDAVTFIYTGYMATKLTDEKFGYTPEDGTIGNAYRLALWNALLKQKFMNEKKQKCGLMHMRIIQKKYF